MGVKDKQGHDATWSQFKDEKVKSEEKWRSGDWLGCLDDFSICWMTFFCFPCQVGRTWDAAKNLRTYSTDYLVCAATACLPCCAAWYFTYESRNAVRKIGDSNVDKKQVHLHIPGSEAEDLVCAICCTMCTQCHCARELKARSYPTGTVCQNMS